MTRAAYSVANIEAKYATENCKRSFVNMLFRCVIGPLRSAKLDMNVMLPRVKHRANLCGRNIMTGNPMAKDNMKNTPESAMQATNPLNRVL
mmetsp:Transcript_15401/g.20690  ORF Transcript_15401/g.20690 Transcript_15401/m.20690 type:complete len:91 (-) Transcript_15401:280-552(-)